MSLHKNYTRRVDKIGPIIQFLVVLGIKTLIYWTIKCKLQNSFT